MRRPRPGYESRSTPTERILDAAIAVFLRHGYKKTSMDELAAGAGLSRPGLYFHFATKEQLFTAALARLIQGIRAAVLSALSRADLHLADRLFAAFEALHPKELDFDLTGKTHELLDAAISNGPDLVEKLRRDFVRSIARALDATEVGAAWKARGVTAQHLAEHLMAASDGIKSRSPSPSSHRARLRLAIRIVLAPAGGGQ